MLRNLLFLVITGLLATFSFANTPHKSITHVIYITLDGVRWQDVFLDHSHFPIFWKKYAKSAAIYGEPNSQKTMEVASIPISLPSYQSQMSGAVQPCDGNECKRIKAMTLPESLVKKFGFNKKDVASFASWEVIDYAFESKAGTTVTNNGTRPMHDPDTHKADAVMQKINQQQTLNYPGDDSRPDDYTFAQAIHYLEKYQPRFMWISLEDSDVYAHENDLTSYHQALTYFDYAIDHVVDTLKKLNLDQETMIIITTDHGRGNGDNWTEHGPEFPESKRTWAFVLNGELELPTGAPKNHYSTLSIRPTVEKAFGLKETT